MRLSKRLLRNGSDEGVALVTAIIFLAVVGALATAVTTVTITGTQNANRDRQAGSALATAEAGISEALKLLNSQPAGYFTCNEPAAGVAPGPTDPCVTNPAGWTSSASPMKISPGGTPGTCVTNKPCYSVWIATVTPYSSTLGYGIYRIHSTGLSVGGPAGRSVIADAKVSPAKFPIGVYADDASTGGNFGINHESLFTKGCLTQRNFDSYDSTSTPTGAGGGGISFSGVDPQYDLPAAAHAVQYVTQANSGCSSASSNNANSANVHDSTQSTGSQSWSPCNGKNYYDQDSQGGDLSGTTCYKKWTSPTSGKQWPTTSKFTLADLASYGYRSGGLSDSEYKQLKATAIAASTYFTSSSTSNLSAALTAANATNPVIYFDLTSGGGSVTLKPGDIPSKYFRPTTDTNCSANFNSITLIVRGGSLTYNSSGQTPGPLVASVFVPDANYSGQGGAEIIGSLFAASISGSGTQDWYLDQCFVNNPPSPVMNVQVVNYREVDTQNIS